MTFDTVPEAALQDSELVLKFESLGDNCELGIVQRMAGVEPLGLFRFAGVPLRHLIRAMEARFEGMADPKHVRVRPENGEYMINLTKYDFVYHAYVKVGEADPEALHTQQVRTLGFLIRKLIADLENPTKIMVFRQNEPLLANDLIDLRVVLAAYGPAKLLWVQEARPGHPPGTVVVVDDRLMVGYVRRLAMRENVPDLDLASWLSLLRKAYAVHRDAAPAKPGAAKRTVRTDIGFGVAGNAAGCTGDGWSAPEDGFTWSIEDRSLLTIDSPGSANDFWLEMDVVPFVAPPSVVAQSLSIAVNGERVHGFDQLERGRVGCTVPARLLHGRNSVEIVFEHPKAASPRAVAGQSDDRRLAVAFYSLSLIGS
jgi:hypothetical protein